MLVNLNLPKIHIKHSAVNHAVSKPSFIYRKVHRNSIPASHRPHWLQSWVGMRKFKRAHALNANPRDFDKIKSFCIVPSSSAMQNACFTIDIGIFISHHRIALQGCTQLEIALKVKVPLDFQVNRKWNKWRCGRVRGTSVNKCYYSSKRCQSECSTISSTTEAGIRAQEIKM